MNYSLNEIEALAKRAARGGGMPWGLAEEASKSTRWLASFDLPGPELLADLLTLNETTQTFDSTTRIPRSLDGVWTGASALCPIATGATLSDCAPLLADGRKIEMRHVSYPLLILPFAAAAARLQNLVVTVEWQGVSLVTDGAGIAVQGTNNNLTASSAKHLCCFAGAGHDALRPPKIRGQMDAECMEKLSWFAMRSFAPATEESRELGAGSSETYND